MTLLVTSIAPTTLDQLRSAAEQAWAGGSDAVEVRIDLFENDLSSLPAYFNAHQRRAWIVTCRSQREGGYSCTNAVDRAARLVTAAGGTAACVDVELADWCESKTALQTVLDAWARTDVEAGRLILSSHDCERVPPNLHQITDELLSTDTAAAGKVAYLAEDICDSFAALDLMHEHGARMIAISMGPVGLWSRILAKKLGAFATYCCLTAQSSTASGQATLGDMVNLYRWQVIDSSTKVFGVLGDPVAHSMGPLLFNHWFSEAGINAVYIPLQVSRGANCLAQFLDACLQRPWLDIGGFSVTLPHKVAALHWVGEGADRSTASIGAINTLVFGNGTVRGYNTDCHAAIDSLAGAAGCERTDLASVPIDVLGTGGAAQAVLAGLRYFGCRTTVYGRSPERTRSCAQRFNCMPAAWEDRATRTGEILINCTSVGIWPAVNKSPMPAEGLAGCRLVFDLIYNPLQTRLLREAAAAGVRTLNGLDMFVRQAATQFGLWTSKTPDVRSAGDIVTRAILETRGRPE